MTQYSPRRIVRLLVVPLLALFPLFAGGCANDQRVMAQAGQVHTGLQPAVITDPELDRYIDTLGERIIVAAKEVDRDSKGRKRGGSGEDDSWMFSDRMKFHFVNSKTLNAFTTGGEKMYIYTGLLQQCRTEDELTAVMAHEYGHVYAHHVQGGMNRQLALMLGAGALGAVGYAAGGKESGAQYAQYGAGAGMAMGQLVNSGFSREAEAEADEVGFRFYTRAGWDPQRFGDFFKTMAKQVGKQGVNPASSHPTLASRVEAAERRARQLGPDARAYRREPVADAGQFRALQERALRVGQSMPDDQSLQKSKQLLQALPRSCLLPDQPVPPDARRAQEALVEDAEKSRAGAPRPTGKARRAGYSQAAAPADDDLRETRRERRARRRDR